MTWSGPSLANGHLGFLTAGGLVIILVLLLTVGYPSEEAELAFGGMVRHDMAAVVFQTIFLVAAAITAHPLDGRGKGCARANTLR